MQQTTRPDGRPYDVRDFVLERLTIAGQFALGRHVGLDVDSRAAIDFATGQLVAGMSAKLWAYRLGRELRTIREAPRPVTWLDHLLHALPYGSWRRRILRTLRGSDARYEHREHVVERIGWATFPDCPIVAPPELGRVAIVEQTSVTTEPRA